jgi:hypothetical protein
MSEEQLERVVHRVVLADVSAVVVGDDRGHPRDGGGQPAVEDPAFGRVLGPFVVVGEADHVRRVVGAGAGFLDSACRFLGDVAGRESRGVQGREQDYALQVRAALGQCHDLFGATDVDRLRGGPVDGELGHGGGVHDVGDAGGGDIVQRAGDGEVRLGTAEGEHITVTTVLAQCFDGQTAHVACGSSNQNGHEVLTPLPGWWPAS